VAALSGAPGPGRLPDRRSVRRRGQQAARGGRRRRKRRLHVRCRCPGVGFAEVVDPFCDRGVVVKEEFDEAAGHGVGEVALGELIERGDQGLGILDAGDDEQVSLPLEGSRAGGLQRADGQSEERQP